MPIPFDNRYHPDTLIVIRCFLHKQGRMNLAMFRGPNYMAIMDQKMTMLREEYELDQIEIVGYWRFLFHMWRQRLCKIFAVDYGFMMVPVICQHDHDRHNDEED